MGARTHIEQELNALLLEYGDEGVDLSRAVADGEDGHAVHELNCIQDL